MSDPTSASSNSLQTAVQYELATPKRQMPSDVALAPVSPKQPRRALPISRPSAPKSSIVADIRQRKLTHNRAPTPHLWIPKIKSEIDDDITSAAVALPARSSGKRPAVEDHAADPLVSVKTEPEDDGARAVDLPVAACHGAAQTRDATDREDVAAGKLFVSFLQKCI